MTGTSLRKMGGGDAGRECERALKRRRECSSAFCGSERTTHSTSTFPVFSGSKMEKAARSFGFLKSISGPGSITASGAASAAGAGAGSAFLGGIDERSSRSGEGESRLWRKVMRSLAGRVNGRESRYGGKDLWAATERGASRRIVRNRAICKVRVSERILATELSSHREFHSQAHLKAHAVQCSSYFRSICLIISLHLGVEDRPLTRNLRV
jgi:hypothetical protein